MRGNIRVFCRVRPPKGAATAEGAAPPLAVTVDSERGEVMVCALPKDKGGADKSGGDKDAALAAAAAAAAAGSGVPGVAPPGAKVFEFDNVFGGGSTQTELFNEIAPLVTSVLDGCVRADPSPGVARGGGWALSIRLHTPQKAFLVVGVSLCLSRGARSPHGVPRR